MSESIYQLKLNNAIDAVFAKIAQRTETPNAAPAEPQTLAEARKASAQAEDRYQVAINKVFAALKAPESEPTLAAAEPQTRTEDLPADFLPLDQVRGGDHIEAQPAWTR